MRPYHDAIFRRVVRPKQDTEEKEKKEKKKEGDGERGGSDRGDEGVTDLIQNHVSTTLPLFLFLDFRVSLYAIL